MALVKSECNKLAEKVWLVEEERCKFDKHYFVLSGDKTAIEAQVVALDREVDRLSSQVQDLAIQKATFVERMSL